VKNSFGISGIVHTNEGLESKKNKLGNIVFKMKCKVVLLAIISLSGLLIVNAQTPGKGYYIMSKIIFENNYTIND
jgi:hypothetical protein